MPSKKPAQRLADIVENIDAIRAFTEGMVFEDFAHERATFTGTNTKSLTMRSSGIPFTTAWLRSFDVQVRRINEALWPFSPALGRRRRHSKLPPRNFWCASGLSAGAPDDQDSAVP